MAKWPRNYIKQPAVSTDKGKDLSNLVIFSQLNEILKDLYCELKKVYNRKKTVRNIKRKQGAKD